MRRMVAVISDLHFEEERSDIIGDPSDPAAPSISFRRNVPSIAFENMMRDVASMAETNGVDQIDFVLAGDIVDLHRTQLWFSSESELRPYVDCRDVQTGSALEAKLLSIFDATVSEEDVIKNLAVFRRFAAGGYLDKSASAVSEKKFSAKTNLHFIPGNHDRMINATPALRRRLREALGIAGGDAPFEHHLRFEDPPVLVRHGHEYDPTNFALDLSNTPIDEILPDELYDKPAFGDFVTVMIASSLPFRFRRLYGDTAILNDPVLQAVYLRILEFDDVRPQAAVVDFFFNMTIPPDLAARFASRQSWQRHIWKIITPVIIEVLEDAANEQYFSEWMRKFRKGYLLLLLKLRLWRVFGFPFWFSRLVGYGLGRVGGGQGPQSFAAHEKAIAAGAMFAVAGHTHQPQVAHLFTQDGAKRYFADTGTWRNAILTAGDRKSYGRVNATTYVVFYGAERDPAATPPGEPCRGFEYWTGYDQSWPINGSDG